jgi:hypothetical protein
VNFAPARPAPPGRTPDADPGRHDGRSGAGPIPVRSKQAITASAATCGCARRAARAQGRRLADLGIRPLVPRSARPSRHPNHAAAARYACGPGRLMAVAREQDRAPLSHTGAQPFPGGESSPTASPPRPHRTQDRSNTARLDTEDHFRTDASYLPDLRAHLDDLLRSRERLAAAGLASRRQDGSSGDMHGAARAEVRCGPVRAMPRSSFAGSVPIGSGPCPPEAPPRDASGGQFTVGYFLTSTVPANSAQVHKPYWSHAYRLP